MITRPTVFILGAGASMPYGFPSGMGIRRAICEMAEQQGLFRTLTKHCGLDAAEVLRFASEFRDAGGVQTIDLFLQRRSEFREIGMVILASLLCPHESPTRLVSHAQTDATTCWYSLLWNHMQTRTADDFAKNRLTVITFNYDRSLEEYLHRCLRANFRLDEATASELLKQSLAITHVYGSLGEHVAWGGSKRRAYRPFDPSEKTIQELRGAAECMRLIHDEPLHDLQDARKAVAEAEFIAFLGFGFHEENIEALALPRITRHPLATWLGMAEGEKVRATSDVARHIDRAILFTPKELNCREALRFWHDLK